MYIPEQPDVTMCSVVMLLENALHFRTACNKAAYLRILISSIVAAF